MVNQIVGIKRHMTQVWTTNGLRIPVSIVRVPDCTVLKKGNSEGKLLVGAKAKKLKNVAKPQRSEFEKSGLKVGFVKTVEISVDGDDQNLAAGTIISPATVFSVGDMVKVTGTSKGTGFTGVVKRWGFKGGPRTHGQADRERAPGSIGSGTTPGRVYKNKKMAGRAGNERVTVIGLQVVAIDGDEMWIKGLIPGAMNGIVTVTKMAAGKFEGILSGPKVKADQAMDSASSPQVSGSENTETKSE